MDTKAKERAVATRCGGDAHVIEDGGLTKTTLVPSTLLENPRPVFPLTSTPQSPCLFFTPTPSTSVGTGLNPFIIALSTHPHAVPYSFAGFYRRPQA